jgi:hypothetical protein
MSEWLSPTPPLIAEPLNNPYVETQAPKTKETKIGYQKDRSKSTRLY